MGVQTWDFCIFTDASENAMCILKYLQDEATLKLTYVKRKCLFAPIRHMRIPKLELQAAVYGVRLRVQILSKHDVRIDKIYHWTNSSNVLQLLQAAHRKQKAFFANRAAELVDNSSLDLWWHVKGFENPADIGSRGMSIECLKESVWMNGPAWRLTDEETWLNPWCHVNEFEAEHANSNVATENKVDQLFDWRQYSTINRIRNSIAYWWSLRQSRRGTWSRRILFRFVQNESFPNVSKSIADSKETSKTLSIAKLSSFVEEDGEIRVKNWLKHLHLDYIAKHPILLTAKPSSRTTSVGESTSWQPTWGHRI